MTVGVEHVCEPMDNPRHADTCRKCGRPMPEGLKRNRKLEAETIRQLTAGAKVDPEPLIMFAQRRADHGESVYGHDFPSLERDFIQEILDELADGAIYTVWYLDAIQRGLLEGGDRVKHLQFALRHVAHAFEEIRSAR